MRVLVVGASGKLGRAIVKCLKQRGYWLRVLIRESSMRAYELQSKQCEIGGLGFFFVCSAQCSS